MDDGSSALFWLMALCFGGAVIGNYFALEDKKLKYRMRQAAEDESLKEIVQRLEKIERRMANIETIVLDREKQQEFERRL